MEKVFEWNDCGVCTNYTLTEVINEKYFSAKVETAMLDGRWLQGYRWQHKVDDYESACCGISRDYVKRTFDTEDDAIQFTIENIFIPRLQRFIESTLSRRTRYDEDGNEIPVNVSAKVKVYERYIEKCRAFIESKKQLTLF